MLTDPAPGTVVAAGHYALYFGGDECGGERWSITRTADGYAIAGVQRMGPPHPLPNRQEYRALLTPDWRPAGLDIAWEVGERRLVATHRADGTTWRARIEHDGHVREQQGDFPGGCEIEFTSHLANLVILARRDFQVGGEHDFPVLRIGPPLMAVTPERMVVRCDEHATFAAALGEREAKRYVAWLPSEGEPAGYTFWADLDGFVLESYEGHDPTRPWMRLVELDKA